MATLQFKQVTQQVESLSFDCGVNSINDYVKNSYYPLITQQAYAYSIMCGKDLLGFYQIMFREIKLNDLPDDISEYDSGIKDGIVSAAHIRYIAIDKRFHGHKIGTGTLRSIIKEVDLFSESWPIRVITIDARNDLVNWYKEEGFREMTRNTEGQDGTTVAMYFDCMKFSDALEAYINSII